MALKIDEVHFNHDQSSASSDAMNIRKNFATAIQAPEWKDGVPPQPAAYAVAALGNTVTIKAKFSGGPPNGTLTIRAVDAYVPPSTSGCLGWLIALIAAIVRALFGNVLGDVAAQAVAFDAGGQSSLDTFTLVNHKLKVSGVGIRTTDWNWQYKKKKKWLTFGATHHTTYVVLDVPTLPWQQSPAGNNTQWPWADALDKACLWALGAATKDEAAKRITIAINTRPNQSYTPVTIFGYFPPYQLTSYMNQLDGGQPFSLNCTDCADAVTTFSNLLGCDLGEGQFHNMVTRKFLTLNGDPGVPASWVSWSWGYHEICWLGGAIGVNELIYDGCLQVDMDDNYGDAVHTAQHPVKMRFGTTGPNDYRYRLVDSGAATLDSATQRRSVA
jgi:hypothetical protein